MSEATTSSRSQGAVSWYQTLFTHLDLEVTVEGKDHGDLVEVLFSGTDAKTFLNYDDGAAAQSTTILAQQALGTARRFPRLRLSETWMERKAINVEGVAKLAGRLGAFVEKSGQSVIVMGMESQGRKALHHGLRDAQVETQSQGYGAFRHLRIAKPAHEQS